MPLSSEDFRARACRLRLVLLDVDGVLTDGTVTIDAAGRESKVFGIRDGLAIRWAQRGGLEVGLLSGRPSQVTTWRAAELGIRIVSQGGANDKKTAFDAILAEHGYRPEEVAYMGDDVLDLPVLLRAGVSAATADAAVEVRARVHWVSRWPGGRGAVREFIEAVLEARGEWNSLVDSYLV